MTRHHVTTAIFEHVEVSRVSGIPYFYPKGTANPENRSSILLEPCVRDFGDLFELDDQDGIPARGLLDYAGQNVAVRIKGDTGKHRLLRASDYFDFSLLPGHDHTIPVSTVLVVRSFTNKGQWPVTVCLMPTASLPSSLHVKNKLAIK